MTWVAERRARILCMLFFSLFGITSAPTLAQALDADSASPRGTPLYLETAATFYADNLEYANTYSVGRTYLGAFASLQLLYLRPSFDLSLGAFVQRDFGDEEEVSQALPLFRLRYRASWWQLVFGQIDSTDNHGLPEALVARQYRYRYPVEEGVQILADYENFNADLWINWYLLNTPEHREFFAAGFHSQASWYFLSADLGLRISHHGGQLYDGGPISDDVAGMIRVVLSQPWRALDAEYGASGTLLGSYDGPDRSHPAGRLRGYGAEAEAFLSPRGWKLYYKFFSGQDFVVEQGDPLYRTRKPLHRFGVEKIFRIDHELKARLQGEGVVIEDTIEYNYCLVLDVALDLLLHRFATGI